MSENLKNDIMKAVTDNKNASGSSSVVFKDPQMLQHSLNKSLKAPQILTENGTSFHSFHTKKDD